MTRTMTLSQDVDEQEELNDDEEDEAWDGYHEDGTQEDLWDKTEEDFE